MELKRAIRKENILIYIILIASYFIELPKLEFFIYNHFKYSLISLTILLSVIVTIYFLRKPIGTLWNKSIILLDLLWNKSVILLRRSYAYSKKIMVHCWITFEEFMLRYMIATEEILIRYSKLLWKKIVIIIKDIFDLKEALPKKEDLNKSLDLIHSRVKKKYFKYKLLGVVLANIFIVIFLGKSLKGEANSINIPNYLEIKFLFYKSLVHGKYELLGLMQAIQNYITSGLNYIILIINYTLSLLNYVTLQNSLIVISITLLVYGFSLKSLRTRVKILLFKLGKSACIELIRAYNFASGIFSKKSEILQKNFNDITEKSIWQQIKEESILIRREVKEEIYTKESKKRLLIMAIISLLMVFVISGNLNQQDSLWTSFVAATAGELCDGAEDVLAGTYRRCDNSETCCLDGTCYTVATPLARCYNSTGGATYDYDQNETACSADWWCTNSTGVTACENEGSVEKTGWTWFWGLAATVAYEATTTGSCCGDDTGTAEYDKTCNVAADDMINFTCLADKACCTADDKCVDPKVYDILISPLTTYCYTHAAAHNVSGAAADDHFAYCENNIWYDCDRDPNLCSYCDNPATWPRQGIDGGDNSWVAAGESGAFAEFDNGTAEGCCGDDRNEYYQSRVAYPGQTGGIVATDSTDDACCDNALDCIYDKTCNTTGNGYDIDGNSRRDAHCYNNGSAAQWINSDMNITYCLDGSAWNIGGEVDIETDYIQTQGSSPDYCVNEATPSQACCCGDDIGEHPINCTNSSANGDCGGDTQACCNAATKCVDASGNCQTASSCSAFPTLKSYCNAGTWEDPDEEEGYCTAAGCLYNWTTTASCCGDDTDENWYYYYDQAGSDVCNDVTDEGCLGVNDNVSDDACCTNTTYCVSGATCYAPGIDSLIDIDSDGVAGAYCSISGTHLWYDCDFRQASCEDGCGLPWMKGGESGAFGEYDTGISDECCGDDADEFKINKSCKGATCLSDDDQNSCCNATTDCVWTANSTCYGDTQCIEGALDYYCNSGGWDDPDASSAACGACSDIWYDYTTGGSEVSCCGDDGASDNFYYINTSGNPNVCENCVSGAHSADNCYQNQVCAVSGKQLTQNTDTACDGTAADCYCYWNEECGVAGYTSPSSEIMPAAGTCNLGSFADGINANCFIDGGASNGTCYYSGSDPCTSSGTSYSTSQACADEGNISADGFYCYYDEGCTTTGPNTGCTQGEKKPACDAGDMSEAGANCEQWNSQSGNIDVCSYESGSACKEDDDGWDYTNDTTIHTTTCTTCDSDYQLNSSVDECYYSITCTTGGWSGSNHSCYEWCWASTGTDGNCFGAKTLINRTEPANATTCYHSKVCDSDGCGHTPSTMREDYCDQCGPTGLYTSTDYCPLTNASCMSSCVNQGDIWYPRIGVDNTTRCSNTNITCLWNKDTLTLGDIWDGTAAAYCDNTECNLDCIGIGNTLGVCNGGTCKCTEIECDNGCMYIRNSTNSNITIFTYTGNMIITGGLLQSIGTPDGSDFVIKDSSGTNKAWINDVNGSLGIAGSVYENMSAYCTPSGDAFTIKDNSGNCVAYINSTGDLWLRGNLTQNATINT